MNGCEPIGVVESDLAVHLAASSVVEAKKIDGTCDDQREFANLWPCLDIAAAPLGILLPAAPSASVFVLLY